MAQNPQSVPSFDESFEQQLAHRLLEIVPRIMRHIRTEMRAMAKPQLTIAQLRILARLYQGSTTVSDLAEWQGVSTPGMSKMVGILESRGLIKRMTRTEDRRQVEVRLMDEGRQIFLNIRKLVQNTLANDFNELSFVNKKMIFEGLNELGKIYD